MVRLCKDCSVTYDDARCSTICPHSLIMPIKTLDQKILAIDLMQQAQGKYVRFRGGHDPNKYRMQAVLWDGMICVEGLSGEFAPHLFEVVEG